MDLNYLYRRHQIALFMADHAASQEARRAHRGLADGYASKIEASKNAARCVSAA